MPPKGPSPGAPVPGPQYVQYDGMIEIVPGNCAIYTPVQAIKVDLL